MNGSCSLSLNHIPRTSLLHPPTHTHTHNLYTCTAPVAAASRLNQRSSAKLAGKSFSPKLRSARNAATQVSLVFTLCSVLQCIAVGKKCCKPDLSRARLLQCVAMRCSVQGMPQPRPLSLSPSAVCCSVQEMPQPRCLRIFHTPDERWGAGAENHFQEFNEPYAPS